MIPLRCALLLLLVGGCAGCATQPMTYAEWKARQQREARMAQIRRETQAMRALNVVITREEQQAVPASVP